MQCRKNKHLFELLVENGADFSIMKFWLAKALSRKADKTFQVLEM